jgi:TPR repeat protein
MPCARCKGTHGASPQRCIEKCPAEGEFWRHWTEAWGADTPEANRWLQKASEQEKRDASKLRIPKTLWEALEPRDMRRAKVSTWQFRVAQKLRKWTGERAAGKEPIKSAKRSAYLTPPSTTNAPPQPMTAKNVYDQVRGTVNATRPKQKQPEATPTIDDIRKDLENGTHEAKAWATKAMIQHYPEEYVRIHKEREREAQAENAARTAVSKWDEWTRTMDAALRHHEREVEVQGTLLVTMAAEQLSRARRNTTNEAARMIAQRINAGWACETEIKRMRRECRNQARALGLKQAEQQSRLKIQQTEAQRRTKLDMLAERDREHAQGRLMIRRRSEYMEGRTHPETDTTEWEVPMDPDTTATSEWWVAGEG